MTLYLYAVVEAPVALGARGVGDEPLELVAAGGLGVVVGSLPNPVETGLAALRKHDAVLRGLARGGPAVVPLRFGQTAADAAELDARVSRCAAGLRVLLEKLRGCVQMTLRVFGPAREPAAPPAAAGPGTRYLAQRRLGADLAAAAPLRATLSPWVRDERVEARPRGPWRGSIFHLVERAHLDEWRGRASAFLASAPACVTVSGPWPPYAFAAEVQP
jgi:hypothetical protein